MTDTLRFYLAQLNPTVGDVRGNVALVRAARRRAAAAGADLVVTSELVVSGYPPEDLVLKPAFLDAVEQAVAAFAAETKDGGPAVLLGAPWREGGKAYNAALLLDAGTIAAKRYKHDLPNYGVFDEKRVFTAGPLPGPIAFRGVRLGVQICEDMWTPDVSECLQETGSELLVVLNASPFDIEKQGVREQLARDRIAETGLPLVYVNQIGGQDELVFDGGSFVYNHDRTGAAQLIAWDSAEELTTWRRRNGAWRCDEAGIVRPPARLETRSTIAMIVGPARLRHPSNRFPGVVRRPVGRHRFGACTAAVAVGCAGRRTGCGASMLPSRFTSPGQPRRRTSRMRAACWACRLRGTLLDRPEPVAAFESVLAPAVRRARKRDIAEENTCRRAIRGVSLMALSNKFGADGADHRQQVARCRSAMRRIYGDMCGRLFGAEGRLQDDGVRAGATGATPTAAAAAAGGRCGRGDAASAIIDKAPSGRAARRPEGPGFAAALRGAGRHAARPGGGGALGPTTSWRARASTCAIVVQRIARLLHLAEYKRRQAPPGVKIGRSSPSAASGATRSSTRSATVDVSVTMALRFAPSRRPGGCTSATCFTAVVNWLLREARRESRFLLRLDDTDRERARPTRSRRRIRGRPRAGSGSTGTMPRCKPVRPASAATPRALEHAAGRSGAPIPATRAPEELSTSSRKAQLTRAGKPPVYDRAALKLGQDERAALEAQGRKPYWRFLLNPGVVEWNDGIHGPIRIDTATLSDPVIVRADGTPLYTLSSAVDDIHLGITRIIRGDDHITNTAPQIQLLRALGGSVPQFAHLGLLHGPGGVPLSKSLGSESGRDLRARGIEPLALASYLATVGTADPVQLAGSLADLVRTFDLGRHNAAPATFDGAVLDQLNTQAVHALGYHDVRAKLYAAGLPPTRPKPSGWRSAPTAAGWRTPGNGGWW
jgi:NAD+ synthase